MPLGLTIDQERLADICRRYHVDKLELFGSRARGEAGPESDVDLLVTFAPGHTPGLAFVTLAEELESCFGRDVDLLVREDAELDRNPVRRQSVFESVELMYAA